MDWNSTIFHLFFQQTNQLYHPFQLFLDVPGIFQGKDWGYSWRWQCLEPCRPFDWLGQRKRQLRYIQTDIYIYIHWPIMICLLWFMMIYVRCHHLTEALHTFWLRSYRYLLQQRNTCVSRPARDASRVLVSHERFWWFWCVNPWHCWYCSLALSVFSQREETARSSVCSWVRFVERKPRANLFKRESCSLSLQFSVQPVQPDVFGTAESKSAGTAGSWGRVSQKDA